MADVRIITRLDIKGENVVNGVHAEGLRVMGDPGKLAQEYYEQGADEIVYNDVVASLYERPVNTDVIHAIAKNIFIPLTVGGGLKTIADIERVLRAGADKVTLNTHAIRNPKLIQEAVPRFGAQCIVLAVDVKKRPNGTWEPQIEGGREQTNLDALEWIKEGLSLGVGELMITSIDRDGTRKGYDVELIQDVVNIAPVPVVAHGGSKGPESILELYEKTRASGISAASMYHEDGVKVRDVKKFLLENNVHVRP